MKRPSGRRKKEGGRGGKRGEGREKINLVKVREAEKEEGSNRIYQMRNYLLDVAESYQLGFQDAASPVMEGIINFHNYVYVYMVYVAVLVV